ncbi:MAG: tRNA lysidine(34) synthetase TilS [Pseudomonadota bacterium]
MPRAIASPARPDADAVRAATFAALDRLCPPGALGVAVSGGGDSTALLLLAAEWARAQERRIEAVTLDHRLRAESAADAQAVADLARRLSVPHTCLAWETGQGPGGNLQARAREARQQLIGDWASEAGLEAVLLGHTLDDQAETFLLRLARGSGLDGLSGMRERADLAGTLWMRPLLGIRRAALRAWLAALGVPWFEDPSNDDTRFGRVQARRMLAALAPLGITADRLAETAGRLDDDRGVLEEAVAKLAGTARRWGALGEVTMVLPALADAPPALTMRLFGDTLRRVGGAHYAPRRARLEALWARLTEADFGGATLGGCVLEHKGGDLIVYREPAAQAARVAVDRGGVWDGRWSLRSGALPDSTGLGALGAEGVATVRAALDPEDLPAAWHTAPHGLRLALPALWYGGDLLAVPHLGYRSQALRTMGAKVEMIDHGHPDRRAVPEGRNPAS